MATAILTLQNELTGALIGLARAGSNDPDLNERTTRLILDGLCATLPNTGLDEAALRRLIDEVRAHKTELMPDCSHCTASCGRISDYDLALLGNPDDYLRDVNLSAPTTDDAKTRNLKWLLLLGLRSLAACARQARQLGRRDDAIDRYFYKSLMLIGDDWGFTVLQKVALELGVKYQRCMDLLEV